MTSRCPRCRTPLSPRRNGEWSVGWCPGCEGLWLDGAALAALERREAGPLVQPERPGSPIPPRVEEVRSAPCAVCAEPMRPRSLGRTTGVVADVCASHGVWLEGDELVRLAAFIQEGDLEQARLRAVEQRALAETFEGVFEVLGAR